MDVEMEDTDDKMDSTYSMTTHGFGLVNPSTTDKIEKLAETIRQNSKYMAQLLNNLNIGKHPRDKTSFCQQCHFLYKGVACTSCQYKPFYG